MGIAGLIYDIINQGMLASEGLLEKFESEYEDFEIELNGGSFKVKGTTGTGWDDVRYVFARDEFEIEQLHTCDGGDDVWIKYRGKDVYCRTSYESERPRTLLHKRGRWRKLLQDLHEEFFDEQLRLRLS